MAVAMTTLKVGYLADLDDHSRVYGPEHGVFLVLIEEGTVVGCGGVRRWNASDGELVRLGLKPEQRNKGLGRALLDELMRVAEARGYARVYLDTSARCTSALTLFRRNGFVDCPPYKESLDDLFLCRTLSVSPPNKPPDKPAEGLPN